MTSLPPIGCLPGAITLFGFSSNECVASLNSDAISFNEKLNTTSNNLQNMLPGLNLVIFDIYQPLYDLVTKPSENGTAYKYIKFRYSSLDASGKKVCMKHQMIINTNHH